MRDRTITLAMRQAHRLPPMTMRDRTITLAMPAGLIGLPPTCVIARLHWPCARLIGLPPMRDRTITLAMRRAHRLAPLVCTRIDILALVAIPITVFLATLVLMKLAALVLVTPVGILDHPAVLATNAHIKYS